MILSKVDKLSRLHKAIIVAQFAPKTSRCPCCKSPTDELDWLAAIRQISDAAVGDALSTHISSRVLRDAIVVGYFGKKDVKLSSAADMAGGECRYRHKPPHSNIHLAAGNKNNETAGWE